MNREALTIQVVGVDQTIDKLNHDQEVINNAIKKGLLALALMTQSSAMRKTPVEYGTLRASAFTRRLPNGYDVEVGFSASYAKFVHEAVAEKLRGQPRPSGIGTYWNPGESKFLEKAVAEVQPLTKSVVQRYIDNALKTRSELGEE